MERRTEFKFFTIADFKEEEAYLRKKHNEGWKLVKAIAPIAFVFERCEEEDVIYQLDYKNNEESIDYMQMFDDYGWEYVTRCAGWLYFRKNAAVARFQNEEEIFSDTASKIDMLEHIVKTRMTPTLIIFCCCVVPNTIRLIDVGISFFSCFFAMMFVLYVYLITHCFSKIKKMRKELE